MDPWHGGLDQNGNWDFRFGISSNHSLSSKEERLNVLNHHFQVEVTMTSTPSKL